MAQYNEHFRLVCRLIELKSQKLKNGSLSIDKQIGHDQLVDRIAYLSEKNCKKFAKIMKKIKRDKKRSYK